MFLTAACAAAPGCGPDKLGTERTLTLSTAGGFAIGLQTYPQTLALADHEVVLTFDDGPWPTTTPKVLDALARECVKATFFLIGRNARPIRRWHGAKWLKAIRSAIIHSRIRAGRFG